MALNATLQYKHKTCSKTGTSKFHVLTPEGNNSDVLMAIYDILFHFHFLPDARVFQKNITINNLSSHQNLNILHRPRVPLF